MCLQSSPSLDFLQTALYVGHYTYHDRVLWVQPRLALYLHFNLDPLSPPPHYNRTLSPSRHMRKEGFRVLASAATVI